MDMLIGVGMLLYFIGLIAYSLITQDFEYSLKVYAQLAVSGGGAFYILVAQNFSKIKAWIASFKKEDDTLKLNDEYSLKDFEALTYLKKRALQIQSKEAYKLVTELNNLLFKGDAPVEENIAKKAKEDVNV